LISETIKMASILSPTLIIYNCRIPDFWKKWQVFHTALAVVGDCIVALGTDAEILSLATAETRKINGHGALLLPGLIDSHTHFTGYASRKLKVDLSACKNLESALEHLRRKVRETPPGSWITGGGWDKNVWELPDFPDKKLLDQISKQHFIALNSKDWHTLWVNSAVLERCGITERTSDPDGGKIRRYSGSAEPTGILFENARQVVFEHIPSPTPEQLKYTIREAFGEFHRKGITAIHCMETPHEFSLYQDLKKEGTPGLRIFFYFPVRFLSELEKLGIHSGLGDSFLKIAGVKIFADGALGSQTAALLENYQGLDHRGIDTLSENELKSLIARCNAQQLACAVHAIGDRANRIVLRAFGEVSDRGEPRLRHRIEHAQLLSAEDIPLFKKLGIIASVQPIHLAADIPLIEKYLGRRGRFAYAFRSLLDSGAVVAFGSDTPIEDFDPWKAMFMAVERKFRIDPHQPSFYPEEKISLSEALRAYTGNAAYAAGEEQNLGSIEIGMKADFILIDQDIFNMPAEALLNTRVLLTVLDGEIVYRDATWQPDL